MAFGLIASACVTATSDDLEPAVDATADPSPLVAADAAEAEASGSPEADTSPAAELPASPITEPSASPVPSDAAAPSAVPTPSPPGIGYIGLDGSQAYAQAVRDGLRTAAAEAGVELVECDSGGTSAGVRACAEDMAEAGVSGVVSMQPFSDLTGEVCETLGNVPVVGIAYEQGPCQVSLLQVDQESGRLAGAALGALVADRWECEAKAFVTLESSTDDPIGEARVKGIRQGYREHCALPKTKFGLADAQHLITAKTQMAEVLDDLSGRPVIVAGVSDVGVLGAIEAAQEAGKAERVWAAGQLAEGAARQSIACDKRYLASVAHFPERFGAVVVPTLVDAMEGREVSPELESGLTLVTADNVRDLFPDTPACGA